ncbi:hypothetical protein EI94DRAFT_1703635 [Lactarius quietus]|nr:hypothetical protein EI94DRAFT_1703635 [Lactarius quietus]
MYVVDLSHDVIDNIDTPPINNNLPATVEGCRFFSLQGLGDIGTPDVVDEGFGNIETMWDVPHKDPMQDNLATTLDIIVNIPRLAFSTQQIQMMFWFLKSNGVSRIPSAKTFTIKIWCCTEMANLRVCNYLHFYPEDAGKTVSEYWHARHWHEVADPSLVTPMVVINNTQFFIYELAILTNSSVVMPYCWFLQGRLPVGTRWSCLQTRTDPEVGNHWNQSKRWNKHYSFLFSAAGLPHALFQHKYNVHFLCTSNLAALLEIMDGIDCVHSDHVLVIPFVAALLGDNLMQSEFACHVGPGGKFLCRICNVKGVDGSINEFHSPIAPTSTDGADGGCTTPDLIGTSDGDGNSSADARAPATGWKRKLESMQDMVARVTRNFLGWMRLSHKNKSGRYDKQVALDRFKATPPESASMLSPMWQIQDTLVDILHTILLRFVKYFWCNVVHNQLGTNPPKKELLKMCLNSLDVSGLQIGQQLSVRTLVQYAGSLTGQDFCIIAHRSMLQRMGLTI